MNIEFAEGAFCISMTNTPVAAWGAGNTSGQQGLSFNASLASSIYGNSDTVSPLSLSTHWFIKH